MTDRALDLVLLGATGFTGRLVAEYLAGLRTPALRWAIAGRNADKLQQVRDGLSRIDPALGTLPVVVADAGDPASLADLAARTRVVCTTVGPYARHGGPLVAACAEAGTDYCDLTGEVNFMRASMDAHHARARATGARIVHACGFDSIPSDLGVLTLHAHVQAQAPEGGGRLKKAHTVVMAARGGFSGGTAASMLDLFALGRNDPALRRLLADPYGLSPDRATDRGPDGRDSARVAYDRDARVWTAPFVMAAVNTRVVRRSNVLMDWAYGRNFSYDEVMSTGRGPLGAVKGGALVAGLGSVVALAALDVTRPWLAKALPASGEGPSEAQRTAGFFKMKVFGTLEGKTEPGYVCDVHGRGDPGYSATARMLAQSAMLLAETFSTERTGGVLTPASALGLPLVQRLRAADVTFDVRSL